MFHRSRLVSTLGFFASISLVCSGQPTRSTLPSQQRCGHANSPKIISGRELNIGEVSWTALIKYRKPNGDQSLNCAGSLINERYVLTAAQCVSGIPEDWTIVGVRLGEHDLSSDQDCEQDGQYKLCADAHQDLQIEKIIVHEDYNATMTKHWNDIALVRLEQDVIYSEYINPICLPVEENDHQRNNTGQRAIEVGWSRTVESRLSDKRLKSALTIQDHQTCREVYKTRGIDLSETQLCAKRAKDDLVCHAMAGSPLMQAVGRTHFLYGISSFGPTRCGANTFPDVFTNVPKYVGWIQSKME